MQKLIAVLILVVLPACGVGKAEPPPPTPAVRAQAAPPTTQPSGPPWTLKGRGNQVFDMPTSVRRVRITGKWKGSGTSNFIVKVNGDTLLNEIVQDPYEGTHRTRGGEVETLNSGNITWTFTEIR